MVVPSDLKYDLVVHLSVGDVRINDTLSPQFIEVYLKAPKTDPFRQGVRIYVGKSQADICPVAAILAYMV